MSKNLTATIALILTLLALSALVLFHTYQVGHYERLVIALRDQQNELERAVNRLTTQLEEGAFTVAAPGAGPSSSNVGADLPPVVRAQRRYFTDEEWAALHAPGNFLVPRIEPYHVEGTVEGGSLTKGFLSDIPGLNPVTQNAADVTELYSYVSRYLANRSRINPDDWVPELAYRVEINDDHTQYHIYLRHGVKWHPPAVDLSDPRYAWLRGDHYVTADDFAFFFELIENPGIDAAFIRNYYEDFDRIEVLNDNEFILHWSRSFQGSIAFSLGINPIPRWLYAYDEDGQPFPEDEFATRFNEHWYNNRAVGMGPFRFVRYEPNRVVELERWDEYFDEHPPIERMIFRIIPDPNTRLNELLAAGIDYTDLFPNQYAQVILNESEPAFHDGSIEHTTYQGTTYRYLGWNADRPLFRDRRVRRAMTHALNRQRMIEEIFHGLGRVTTGNFFMDGPYYNHEIEPYPFDLTRASELLAEAGWVDTDNDGVRDKVVDGNRLDFEFTMLTYGYRPEFMAAMDIYRQDLASLGIRMTVEGVQWPIMIERMEEKDFDAYTGGWQLSWDADPYQIFHSSQADLPNGSNRVGFRNAEADQIIETARATFDVDERIRLFHRFHEIMHEEQPYTFFFAPLEVGAWRERVDNVNFAPLRPFDLALSWFVRDAN